MTARTPATPTRPVEVTLTTDLLAGLTTRERTLLALLLDACVEMDQIFWQEAAGDRNAVLSSIEDPDTRSLVDFNYGPWDRRRENAPLVPGVGPKAAGAGFYPPDMDVIEFEAACAESPERAAELRSPYPVVRRDGSGRLVAVSGPTVHTSPDCWAWAHLADASPASAIHPPGSRGRHAPGRPRGAGALMRRATRTQELTQRRLDAPAGLRVTLVTWLGQGSPTSS